MLAEKGTIFGLPQQVQEMSIFVDTEPPQQVQEMSIFVDTEPRRNLTYRGELVAAGEQLLQADTRLEQGVPQYLLMVHISCGSDIPTTSVSCCMLDLLIGNMSR